MADASDSRTVPAAHGPVTAAIRAVAAEHDPSRSGVVWLAQERARPGPAFTPIDFSFPLTDSLWGATYLPAVRAASDVLALRGRELVARIAAVSAAEPLAVRTMLSAMTTTIDHLEEVVEALRIARGRLHEATSHLGRPQAGSAAR